MNLLVKGLGYKTNGFLLVMMDGTRGKCRSCTRSLACNPMLSIPLFSLEELKANAIVFEKPNTFMTYLSIMTHLVGTIFFHSCIYLWSPFKQVPTNRCLSYQWKVLFL
jgi:hypothetical protein